MIFADVIIDISVKSLDRPFQYLVPEQWEEDAVVGAQVWVPFGQGNRRMKGFIVGLSGQPQFDIHRTKSILEIEKQGVVVESHLLSLAYWIKENYGSTMSDAIKVVMPVRQETREKQKRTIVSTGPAQELRETLAQMQARHYTAKARVVEALLESPDPQQIGMDYGDCLHRCHVAAHVIRGLQEEGILRVESAREYRNPQELSGKRDTPLPLNEEQQNVADSFWRDYEAGKRGVYLIHGVTGSGKTETYMHMIRRVLDQGLQVIVLIPEIALTFQTVGRFYRRFGDRVSVMHSRLSAGERYDQFCRAKNGEIDIMVGPRSALFTPFERLGLIVIDEEHESSYQSDMPPKYHAREVAIQRANMLGASVVLGSATPSVEAYYRAMKGEYKLLTLTRRATGARMPRVWITDLRKELEQHNYSIFGQKLDEMIRDRLDRKEQTILFLNRRGYGGFVSCRKCGEPVSCPHCSVSLKAHLLGDRCDRLECHYCGYSIPMMKQCPACGSPYIGVFGIGTQKVEQMVRQRYPQARVLRMDADTTGGKEGHSRILQQFERGEADILVGTQMIVKGHDFPNVTLVGVLAADLSLNVGDYRAAERTFQLLAQAAGRAGRAEKPGDVVFQTYRPEDYAIVSAAAQDYQSFYREEIALRQILHYPPVSNILGVLVISGDPDQAAKLAGALAQKMKSYTQIDVLGPAQAEPFKIRDAYRYRLYAKYQDFRVLRSIKNELEAFMRSTAEYTDCRIQFDVNG